MAPVIEFGHDITTDKAGGAGYDNGLVHGSVFLSVNVEHALDRAGGGAALDHVGQHDAAAVGFDDFAPADVVRPVFALDQHLRQDFSNQVLRLVLVEEHDTVHALERGEHVGAVVLGVDRTAVALIALDRGVTVEPDAKRVGLLAGEAQVRDVAAVQDVETAIGEGEFLSLSDPFVAIAAGLFDGHDF